MQKRKGKEKTIQQEPPKPNKVLEPCIRCGKQEAEVINFKGLYYVQCPCNKYDRWQFCGYRPQGAIDSWNYENRTLNRQGMHKK